MAPSLHDAPLFKHAYLIRIDYGGKPMRYHQRRSISHEIIKCLLHKTFRLSIER